MKKLWVVFESATAMWVAVMLATSVTYATDAPQTKLNLDRISEDNVKLDPFLIHPWDNPQGKDTTKPQGARVNGDVRVNDMQGLAAGDSDCCETVEASATAPNDLELLGNYPNPFNAETRIAFGLTEAGKAELRIYNILGQTVRAVDFAGLGAGRHEWNWDGRVDGGGVAPSGVYFYRVTTLRSSAIDKMVLLK